MIEPTKGDWFQTFTGKAWWPMGPRPEDVDLLDIAHGLAFQCRFNGHTRQFYSVADHCIRMAAELHHTDGPEVALAGLLHDAAEAYLGDIVRPVKRQLPAFYHLERINQTAILEGLHVSLYVDDHKDRIREMDLVMLATERRDLMEESPHSWVNVEKVEPLPVPIKPLSPELAYSVFVTKFDLLVAELAKARGVAF